MYLTYFCRSFADVTIRETDKGTIIDSISCYGCNTKIYKNNPNITCECNFRWSKDLLTCVPLYKFRKVNLISSTLFFEEDNIPEENYRNIKRRIKSLKLATIDKSIIRFIDDLMREIFEISQYLTDQSYKKICDRLYKLRKCYT